MELNVLHTGLQRKCCWPTPSGRASIISWAFPPARWGLLLAWLAVILYTLQIYYDFSGYSDMAIGLGRIFWLYYEETFNYPYLSSSITEFWRRWHISLSTWFRDYLYIPLGGNRKGLGRTCVIFYRIPGNRIVARRQYDIHYMGNLSAFSSSERLWLKKVLDRNPVKFLNHLYAMVVVCLWLAAVSRTQHDVRHRFGKGDDKAF